MSSTTIGVNIGACQCPGTPHPDGDEVHLRERLGLAAGVQLQGIVLQGNALKRNLEETTGLLMEAYLKVGVAAWNLRDADGKPLPVTPETIAEQLLSDFVRATPVAEKADELYMGPVIGPLVNGAARSSPTTPTGTSTSRTASGSQKSPRQSKRSSTSTTPTAATATTSP